MDFSCESLGTALRLTWNNVCAAIVGSPPNSWIECIAQLCASDPEERLGAVDAEDWIQDLLQEMPNDSCQLVLDSSGEGLGEWALLPSAPADGPANSDKASSHTMNGDDLIDQSKLVSTLSNESAAGQQLVSACMADGITLNGVTLYKVEDFLIEIDHLEFGAEIGRGQFSCVSKVSIRANV